MDPIALVGGIHEVGLRMGAALLAGAILGLNRDLRGKPAGLRTHALVSLGAALLTLVALQVGAGPSGVDPSAVTRVVQGIITGIGFLGAGVILRDDSRQTVRGLTTAASIWLVAGFGVACGAGLWVTTALALGLTLLVLVFGGRLEDAAHRLLHGKDRRGAGRRADDPPPDDRGHHDTV
jgi:putative Mg2+ transporter-C (MgtC) family protein